MITIRDNSPAAQILLSDLVENILKYSDNPGACAEYVTTQIRELIGVRMVALVLNEAGKGHNLVGICPPRNEEYWNHQPELQQLITGALAYDAPRLIDPKTDPAGKPLSSIGIGTSFVIPLMVGAERVGMLILLDLLDQRGASIILETLASVSRILALILKNSLLYRNLAQKVAERTEELHAANSRLLRELSERKAAEEALRQLNTDLDRRVLERTAELEATIKEMHAFTYTVSHDLRAPLRHIDGFQELLRKKAGTALDEQSRHYMDTISNSARRMGLLIDDLLSFSRMGHNQMSKMRVDLGELTREVIREFEPGTGNREILWRVCDLPVVNGDRAMLRVVLVNLISNALKFTRVRPQAEIEIGWMCSRETETVIFVRDNGVGFDMTYTDNLFGVFRRLHRTDEFEGTGIGLAYVRRIIARHGGRTWAEGQVNNGATFYFSLPHSVQEA
ncbi:MAG: ATP-binding protein [Pseudomonadota bacterium]